jgi:hypothetical protein
MNQPDETRNCVFCSLAFPWDAGHESYHGRYPDRAEYYRNWLMNMPISETVEDYAVLSDPGGFRYYEKLMG